MMNHSLKTKALQGSKNKTNKKQHEPKIFGEEKSYFFTTSPVSGPTRDYKTVTYTAGCPITLSTIKHYATVRVVAGV